MWMNEHEHMHMVSQHRAYTRKKIRCKSIDSYMGPATYALHLIWHKYQARERRNSCKCNDINIKWTNQIQSAMVIEVDYGPILCWIWNRDSFRCWTLWSIVRSIVRNVFFSWNRNISTQFLSTDLLLGNVVWVLLNFHKNRVFSSQFRWFLT